MLEPKGTLTLAERGGAATQVIEPHPDFRVVATMNPGGDFGKKELSPALANRFNSVWVPGLRSQQELLTIVEPRLDGTLTDCCLTGVVV